MILCSTHFLISEVLFSVFGYQFLFGIHLGRLHLSFISQMRNKS